MSYVLEALSGSVQASALDLSQNGIATLEFQDQHRRLHHVSTLMVGRLGDLWEWTVLNHQQKHPIFGRFFLFFRRFFPHFPGEAKIHFRAIFFRFRAEARNRFSPRSARSQQYALFCILFQENHAYQGWQKIENALQPALQLPGQLARNHGHESLATPLYEACQPLFLQHDHALFRDLVTTLLFQSKTLPLLRLEGH